VLLGLLSFVIYPLLPNNFVDRWRLINPQQAWITVIVIAGIGFVNYVLLRLYGRKGLYYTAVLGGLVNSTAAAAELSRQFAGRKSDSRAVGVLLLTNVAMFLRNAVILAIFAPAAIRTAIAPLAIMAIVSLAFAWIGRGRDGEGNEEQLQMSSPVSLKRVLTFGVTFLIISAVGTLAQRELGSMGFLFVAVLGGLVSSASTTASAATLVISGSISPAAAGVAAVLTSMSSSLIDLPLVYQQTGQMPLTRRLAIISVVIVAIGVGLLVTQTLVLR
jgi:uncharacterized membrane protein (DUF4010 family)